MEMSRESASGLYCKISLTQHTKVIKTKKTEVAHNHHHHQKSNPTPPQVCEVLMFIGCRASFNESFNFKLGAELLDTASVSIQLTYAQPGYNKDQQAGRIVLGSFMFARGKGLDHWTEMVSKQKEQIQYWHAVSE
ncbi:Synaptotagmin-15 [Orchesella cincta]|uniref:Synaptotagmin-15 n=1 Tax=Orchesella cincta TaxID=48709 RepID=A0A1D2M4I6_ORCCI|nr:Synaptotagmin-15 [Orchesella cincta]